MPNLYHSKTGRLSSRFLKDNVDPKDDIYVYTNDFKDNKSSDINNESLVTS